MPVTTRNQDPDRQRANISLNNTMRTVREQTPPPPDNLIHNVRPEDTMTNNLISQEHHSDTESGNQDETVPIAEIERPLTFQYNTYYKLYKEKFDKIVWQMIEIDMKEDKTQEDIRKRKNLVTTRINIEDMLQALKNHKCITDHQRTNNNSSSSQFNKYNPSYPTFMKKIPSSDIKNPYLFIKSLEIALKSSKSDPNNWIDIFLNRLSVEVAEEMKTAIETYDATHEDKATYKEVFSLFLDRKYPMLDNYMKVFMQFKRFNTETIMQLNTRFRRSMQMAGEDGYKKFCHQLYLEQLDSHEKSMVKDYRRTLKLRGTAISIADLMDKAETIADNDRLFIPEQCRDHTRPRKGQNSARNGKQFYDKKGYRGKNKRGGKQHSFNKRNNQQYRTSSSYSNNNSRTFSRNSNINYNNRNSNSNYSNRNSNNNYNNNNSNRNSNGNYNNNVTRHNTSINSNSNFKPNNNNNHKPNNFKHSNNRNNFNHKPKPKVGFIGIDSNDTETNQYEQPDNTYEYECNEDITYSDDDQPSINALLKADNEAIDMEETPEEMFYSDESNPISINVMEQKNSTNIPKQNYSCNDIDIDISLPLRGERLIIPITVDKHETFALVDTGADVSVMKESFARSSKCTLVKYNDVNLLANKKPQLIKHIAGMNLQHNSKRISTAVRLMPTLPSEKYTMIIGLDLMPMLEISVKIPFPGDNNSEMDDFSFFDYRKRLGDIPPLSKEEEQLSNNV